MGNLIEPDSRQIEEYRGHGLAKIELASIFPDGMTQGIINLEPLVNIAPPAHYWTKGAVIHGQSSLRVMIASENCSRQEITKDSSIRKRFNENKEVTGLRFRIGNYSKRKGRKLFLESTYQK